MQMQSNMSSPIHGSELFKTNKSKLKDFLQHIQLANVVSFSPRAQIVMSIVYRADSGAVPRIHTDFHWHAGILLAGTDGFED